MATTNDQQVYDLTHDPKYSDIVVLSAARELLAEGEYQFSMYPDLELLKAARGILEERHQDTENLDHAIWEMEGCPE